VLLPDEFIERPRAHAVGERARALGGGIFVRDGREEIHRRLEVRVRIAEVKALGSIHAVQTYDFQTSS
jgi:hypothetical protein